LLFGDALATALAADDDDDDEVKAKANDDDFDQEMNELIEQVEATRVGEINDDVSNRWRSADAVVNGLAARELSWDARDLAARLYLERAHALAFYQHDTRSAIALCMARRAVGLSLHMGGAQGRRTKFQNFDVANLVLFAEARDDAVPAAAVAAAATAKRQRLRRAPCRWRTTCGSTRSTSRRRSSASRCARSSAPSWWRLGARRRGAARATTTACRPRRSAPTSTAPWRYRPARRPTGRCTRRRCWRARRSTRSSTARRSAARCRFSSSSTRWR
jgi:hypothetical protein